MPGSAFGLQGQVFRAAVVGVVERLVVPHGRGCGAQQEPQVAPVDRQVFELQDRSGREQAVQILRLEPDGRQRYARLDSPLQLEQLDLEVGSGGEVGLILLQSPQLGDLAGLRPGGRRKEPDRASLTPAILAELGAEAGRALELSSRLAAGARPC